MQDDLFEDDDYDAIGEPVTFDPEAKATRHLRMSVHNAPVRMAVCRYLHATDRRNRANAEAEMFWLGAHLIAGDYGGPEK